MPYKLGKEVWLERGYYNPGHVQYWLDRGYLVFSEDFNSPNSKLAVKRSNITNKLLKRRGAGRTSNDQKGSKLAVYE